MADTEQRIVDEYLGLVERSQQLFSGLRDVPHLGKQWQPYFQKTFEVYTKLWKFQQIQRPVLENKDRYGLKRHEIGEIASKIGQLYYHYYLRTSETNYLMEAFVFYEAIRSRQYFKEVLDTKNPMLMVKKLRYYARFVVVCLLLNKKDLVQELAVELKQHVEDYCKTIRPSDTQEWQFVLQELSVFTTANRALEVDGQSKYAMRLAPPMDEPGEAFRDTTIRVQESVLVGNAQQQVKFSELTLDMFRIMQALEIESSGAQSADDLGEARESQLRSGRSQGLSNPHKYLLYRPSFSQLMVFLSTSFKEIQETNALLLYISADGVTDPAMPDADGVLSAPPDYEAGGIMLNSRRLPEAEAGGVNAGCLYPQDLVPFCRRHLFLIVDSTNSAAFSSLPRGLFGKHMLCLLSPRIHPDPVSDASKQGSFFTFFLTDPVSAFAILTGRPSVTQEQYVNISETLAEYYADTYAIVKSEKYTPHEMTVFCQEPFLQRFILNFILHGAVCTYHKHFQNNLEDFLSKSHPAVDDDIYASASIVETVYSVAQHLKASDQFLPRP